MMSPNGSVPPIYVPPGYVSQVGILHCGITTVIDPHPVRMPDCFNAYILSACFSHRSLKRMECGGFWFYLSNQSFTLQVTPLSTTLSLHHMPTCLPSSHTMPWWHRHPTFTQAWQEVWVTWVLSTSLSITPHISTQSRVSLDQPVGTFSDLRKPSNFYVLLLLVSAESHPQHGRPPFVHRDDRTNKAYERLQKKLKDRQGGGGGGQVKDSPPSSPQKSCCSPSTVDIHNGVGVRVVEAEQGHLGHAAVGSTKQAGRGRNGEVGGKRCLQLDCHPAFHRLMFVYVMRIVPYLPQCLMAVKEQTHSHQQCWLHDFWLVIIHWGEQ